MLQKQRSTSELFATIGLITIRTSDVNLEDFGQLDDFGQQGSSDTLRVLEYFDDKYSSRGFSPHSLTFPSHVSRKDLDPSVGLNSKCRLNFEISS